MSRKPRDPSLVCVLAGARYWFVTDGQHRQFLAHFVATGERPGTHEMLMARSPLPPEAPHTLAYGIKARIPWEHGGARNLDLVTPAAAQAYLDKEQS